MYPPLLNTSFCMARGITLIPMKGILHHCKGGGGVCLRELDGRGLFKAVFTTL